MDNITFSHFENDAVQDKKLEHYGWDKKDFLAGQELTVTITLGEYRELVTNKATSEQAIKASRDRAAEAEVALKEAQSETERLKAENYDLQSRLVALQGQRQNASPEPDTWEKEGGEDL